MRQPMATSSKLNPVSHLSHTPQRLCLLRPWPYGHLPASTVPSCGHQCRFQPHLPLPLPLPLQAFMIFLKSIIILEAMRSNSPGTPAGLASPAGTAWRWLTSLTGPAPAWSRQSDSVSFTSVHSSPSSSVYLRTKPSSPAASLHPARISSMIIVHLVAMSAFSGSSKRKRRTSPLKSTFRIRAMAGWVQSRHCARKAGTFTRRLNGRSQCG
mmetsp:Transcript_77471/g.199451  ORF Transcript_77471/g.199451 Transcript_77471/m.199451 type:complete len:211 (-) Transcript_77471:28-660(-)